MYTPALFARSSHVHATRHVEKPAVTQAISEKEFPYSGCWCRVDQNVILGQFRIALQSGFNRLHRRLPERDALVVHFAAQFHHRVQPLPGHLLRPPQHRLGIDQLRAIPLQLQDTPTPLNRILFAMVRRIIQQLHRLVDIVSKLHHAMEKLRPPATALRTVVHFDLEQTRLRLRLLIHRLPLGFDRIDDEVTRFVRAAKGDGQLATPFIHDPTRYILLLAPQIVITGSVVTPREPPT